MSHLLFANNASTTLAIAIATTDTTINLAAGGGALFPAIGSGQYFKITLYPSSGSTPPPEIVNVTARSGDVLTVQRAQEGTTAQSWGVNSIIDNLLTRDTVRTLNQVLVYAGNPNTFVAGTAGTATLPPTMCWDYTNNILYVCTTTGTSGWTPYYAGVSFTPVQQGGGIGQLTNKVYIGFASGGKTKLTIDSTDFGNIALESYVTTQVNAEATARGNADTTLTNNLASEVTNRTNADTTLQNNINGEAFTRASVDSANYTALFNDYVSRIGTEATTRNNSDIFYYNTLDANKYDKSGGTIGGAVTITGPLEVSGATGTTAGGWQMNPSGTGSFSAGVTQSIHTSNDIVASRFIAASDGRIKTEQSLITRERAREFLRKCPARMYIKNGQWDAGFIAQEVLLAEFPEFVILYPLKLKEDGTPEHPDERLAEKYNGWSGPENVLLMLKESAIPALMSVEIVGLMDDVEMLMAEVRKLRDEVDAIKSGATL
jgi:hypothetical protein